MNRTTIRRNARRYDDTPLEGALHIELGRPIDQAPNDGTPKLHENIRTVLQEHTEGPSGALVAELTKPATALLARTTEELKAELKSLDWNASEFGPLEKVAGIIFWTRRDSAGDVMHSALHLLNAAELKVIERDTLTLALDAIWDADGVGTAAALRLLREVLRRRNWHTALRDSNRFRRQGAADPLFSSSPPIP